MMQSSGGKRTSGCTTGSDCSVAARTPKEWFNQTNLRPTETNTTMKKHIALLTVLSVLASGTTALLAATGEVTLSGSTWTGKVDGVTKYTGTDLADAVNYCQAAMTSGTINIRNSGSMTHAMWIASNKSVDAKGCTITGTGTCILRSNNESNVGAKNMYMAGSAPFGMYFNTCNGTSFSAVHGASGNPGIAYRIDNCKGGPGYNFSCGSPVIYAGGNNGIETYGISGNSWSVATIYDRSGGCGVEVGTD